VKVWRVHIQSWKGSALIELPYRAGAPFWIRMEDIPGHLLTRDHDISAMATGPHEVPLPSWWPRLSNG